MEQKSSIQELRKEAVSQAQSAAVCAGGFGVCFVVWYLGAYLNERGAWTWLIVVVVFPFALGMLIFLLLFPQTSYRALEKYWMIRQMKRGVDVDKRSNVLLREGVRGTCFACLFSVPAILWVVLRRDWDFLDEDFIGFLTVVLCLGCLACWWWCDAIGNFRSARRYRAAEHQENQKIDKVLGRLREEIGSRDAGSVGADFVTARQSPEPPPASQRSPSPTMSNTMNNFIFQCPHCAQRIAASSENVGANALCPTCGKSLAVPAPELTEHRAEDAAPGLSKISGERVLSFPFLGKLRRHARDPNKLKAIYLVWLFLHLILLISSPKPLGEFSRLDGRDYGGFYPFLGEYFPDAETSLHPFSFEQYDITEFAFYSLAPLVLWRVLRLWRSSAPRRQDDPAQ